MDSVNELLDKYDRFIKTKARRLARDASEADELAQKANIVLWQQHRNLSQMREISIKAFINKTIKNALIDLRRREKPMVSMDAMLAPAASGKFEDAVLDKMLVMSLIHNLTTEEQDIIFKAYFLGMDSSEIGTALNLPPATIRSKKARAQRKLKNIIKKGAKP